MPFGETGVRLRESKLPLAKSTGIVVQEVDGEVLVFVVETSKAHHLNKTMSLVWRNCNGKTTFGELTEILGESLQIEVDLDFVWMALTELEQIDLLEGGFGRVKEFEGLTRRKVLFRYALPAVALPIVISLVAPRAVFAQSCPNNMGLGNNNMDVGQGGDCNVFGNDCCPGLTCIAAGVVTGVCQPI